MQKEIRFWGKNSKYFEFTNFYMRSIQIDNILWPSSEHYYQANKFIQKEIINEILSQKYPMAVYKLANVTYKNNIRENWNEIKIDVMRKVLREKFSQHEDLKKLLLETDDDILIENSPYDSFWGVGGFGNKYIEGTNNWLGKILMDIRKELSQN